LWIIYNLSNLCQDLGAAENFEIEVKSGLSYSFQLPTKCRLGVGERFSLCQLLSFQANCNSCDCDLSVSSRNGACGQKRREHLSVKDKQNRYWI